MLWPMRVYNLGYHDIGLHNRYSAGVVKRKNCRIMKPQSARRGIWHTALCHAGHLERISFGKPLARLKIWWLKMDLTVQSCNRFSTILTLFPVGRIESSRFHCRVICEKPTKIVFFPIFPRSIHTTIKARQGGFICKAQLIHKVTQCA